MISDEYWVEYIFYKHWSEVIVLVLELLISTAISSSQREAEGSAEKSATARSRESRRSVIMY
jgi:hypothetical protein